MSVEEPFDYVVVEGPIGAGKTTLARRLAQSLDAELLLEAPEDNPFLARFYESPRANALSTQLYFLLQRVRQIEGLRQSDMFSRTRVADYMIDKDRIFAGLTLDADEMRLYDEVYGQVVGEPVRPDLVIYLQASVNVLLQRITERGIHYEADMDPDYLQRLVAAYTHFFYHYDEAPLVIVNTAEIDFAHGQADYQLLFQKIQLIHKGRHYINPLPF